MLKELQAPPVLKAFKALLVLRVQRGLLEQTLLLQGQPVLLVVLVQHLQLQDLQALRVFKALMVLQDRQARRVQNQLLRVLPVRLEQHQL